MTHLINQNCIACKYTECAVTCPAQAFREGPNMLAIDPESCIDCGACVDACPVEAIVSDDNMSPSDLPFLALNAELSRLPGWKAITWTRPAASDADRWAGVPGKIDQLRR